MDRPIGGGEGRLVFEQLLSGRDYAKDDEFARAMVNYSYVIGDRQTGEALLVDPAHAPLELLEHVLAQDLRLTGVVVTHYHADHAGGRAGDRAIAGVAELVEALPVPVHLHEADRHYLLRSSSVDEAALVTHGDGDLLALGALSIALVHTPGHTPGSQCLWFEDLLLSGDTLFLVGCGRTDFDGGDPGELFESLTRRLAIVPDEAEVYPGHAYADEPFALLGALRRTNPVLRPMTREQWLARFGN